VHQAPLGSRRDQKGRSRVLDPLEFLILREVTPDQPEEVGLEVNWVGLLKSLALWVLSVGNVRESIPDYLFKVLSDLMIDL
jgi:hypothetical protein